MINSTTFQQLLELLDEAENLVGQFTGGYSGHFFSAQEFHSELKATTQRVKEGNLDELNTLFVWFAPSYDWDDFTGADGEELGNKVYGLLLNILKPSEPPIR